MKTIYFLGECMVELRSTGKTTMHQSFAGDVYNSAVYLKRCFPDIHTSIVTAIGHDKLSEDMLTQFSSEHLDTELVFRHDTKVCGLYLVETDSVGERSFTYWRSDSAARRIVEFFSEDVIDHMKAGDWLFFSGISLAVIEVEARSTFWNIVQRLHESGIVIVFDPNYRARLWRTEDEARDQFRHAFSLANIVLPGVEDLSLLFGINDAQAVVDFCRSFDIGEIVVKNGPDSVTTYTNGELHHHPVATVKNVVDTTSAGDAFNGAYLGARISGKSVEEAVGIAASAAGIVIQYPGAIAPIDDFSKAMSLIHR